MTKDKFDVIIVGGSYSGLAAGMALGRARRKVLIIDSGMPCNAPTPHSHNFLTQDGKTPKEIATLARQQVQAYKTVTFFDGVVANVAQVEQGFEIAVASGEMFVADKIIFATGIRDILSDLDGMAACWGISVLHCPYCHGYEVADKPTGILANGDSGFDFAILISNWTKELTLFTNGTSTLTIAQTKKLMDHDIKVEEQAVTKLKHAGGYIQNLMLKDGTEVKTEALYVRNPFEQHCSIPEALGCELTEEGYLKIDGMQQTTVKGIYACGDNVSRMRSVANAVSMGTAAGAMVNRELILERF